MGMVKERIVETTYHTKILRMLRQDFSTNSTAQMDKKVRIIFFILLSLCVWIVLQFGLAIYNLFANLI